jgi:phosphatidylglycerol:prolipoprotein diacylglycerol transferase
VADHLAIAGALLMGIGRIGNFIDGQIVGRVTDVWWAVRFPDVEGFRHPVVLYDGFKNLLLVPVLFMISRSRPAPWAVMAHGVLWYGALRAVVDLWREYPTTLAGIATGQAFNGLMIMLGVTLFFWTARRPEISVERSLSVTPAEIDRRPTGLLLRRAVAAFLLCLSLTIPSDWTQDIPGRYGKRHPGLCHTLLYPEVK